MYSASLSLAVSIYPYLDLHLPLITFTLALKKFSITLTCIYPYSHLDFYPPLLLYPHFQSPSLVTHAFSDPHPYFHIPLLTLTLTYSYPYLQFTLLSLILTLTCTYRKLPLLSLTFTYSHPDFLPRSASALYELLNVRGKNCSSKPHYQSLSPASCLR